METAREKHNRQNRESYARMRSTPELVERERAKKRAYYEETRATRLEYISSRVKELREWVNTLRTPCIACGESDPTVIEFHHLNPEEKDFDISRMCGRRASRDRITEEINKCVCLCSNCHKRVHANTLTLLT